MEKEQTLFDPSQHIFAAHVTYDGARMAVYAGPDTDNIALPGPTTQQITRDSKKQIVGTFYYPKEIPFFNSLRQQTLIAPFMEEVKAWSPDAEEELYDYISRILTYGHKIGREMWQQIVTSTDLDASVDELHRMIEEEVMHEKENRTLIDTRLDKYQDELDQKFPKMAAYFEQDYNAESNYTRIEKEDIQSELLLFGIENYVKNIANTDPGFIHRN